MNSYSKAVEMNEHGTVMRKHEYYKDKTTNLSVNGNYSQ